MRYENTEKAKSNGVVYTPKNMADYLAEIMLISKQNINCNECKILDPAIGEGELVVSLLQKLFLYSHDMNIIVVGFETDSCTSAFTKSRINELFPNVSIEIHNKDFIEFVLDNANFDMHFDFIIANPPYIRTQIMGAEKAQRLSQQIGLTGRIDIYYAFLVFANRFLSKDGIAGYITSNKFMTIKAGVSVRQYMIKQTCIKKITDFGDTKIFSAAVLPCIILFGKGSTISEKVEFTSIYETRNRNNSLAFNNIFEAIKSEGIINLEDGKSYEIKQGVLDTDNNGSPWKLTSNQVFSWQNTVNNATWKRFSDIGKIRVGIKTTADSVFIKKEWPDDATRPELLRPLITHRNAGQIISNNDKLWYVLYPHIVIDGKKASVNIEDYPKSLAYLNLHRNQLESRSYIINANRNWFEIWVSQNPDAWKKRKIVFRDISEKPQFWMDESGAVVNGDCYWLEVFDNVSEEILLLSLAVANSSFIEKYYDINFNTKLYAGKRRFMSQYVENFPIPNPDSDLSKQAINIVEKIIANESSKDNIRNMKYELDDIITRIFS